MREEEYKSGGLGGGSENNMLFIWPNVMRVILGMICNLAQRGRERELREREREREVERKRERERERTTKENDDVTIRFGGANKNKSSVSSNLVLSKKKIEKNRRFIGLVRIEKDGCSCCTTISS